MNVHILIKSILVLAWTAGFSQSQITASSGEYSDEDMHINYSIGDSFSTVINSKGIFTSSEGYPTFFSLAINGLETAALSIEAVEVGASIRLFPNPVAKYLSVVVDSFTDNYQLSIHTISGQIIVQQDIIQKQSNFDLSPYPAGIYIIEITNPKTSKTFKLIKK